MHLNITLWTLNMVNVVNVKYIFRHFHVHVAMQPFRIWTKWKQNPHPHDVVNICPEFQSSIHIHYKVTGLQSLEKIIAYAIFAQQRALPCVTKIILTEKLFGEGSSNFEFVDILLKMFPTTALYNCMMQHQAIWVYETLTCMQQCGCRKHWLACKRACGNCQDGDCDSVYSLNVRGSWTWSLKHWGKWFWQDMQYTMTEKLICQ